MTGDPPGGRSPLVLRDAPVPLGAWWRDLLAHREVLAMLARKDFQTRYKRATLGLAWAVAVPILQGAVLAVVFSQVLDLGGGDFAASVLAGTVAWSYFGGTLGTASTAVADGAGLADKVWFPRLLLVLVPGLANLASLAVSTVFLLVLAPVLGGTIGPRTLWVVPAVVLLAGFTLALASALSALHVYFRDVRFLVQAALLVWLYVTPVVYPKASLGEWAGWLDANPLTGIVQLFQRAVQTAPADDWRPVVVTVVVTSVLAVVGLEAHRRHDRLFVDQL